MSFTVTWIFSVSLLVLSFFAIIFIAKFFTKPLDERNFSFMRIFPFEVVKHSDKFSRFYSSFTYLFSGMCFTPLIVLLEEPNKLSALNPLSIIICVLLGLSSVIFVFLHIFDVTHVKAHLVLFSIFSILILLTSALLFSRALTAFNTCKRYGNEESIFIVCEVFEALIFLFVILILFNPKLKTWARLDQVSGEKNKYVRPKKFVLAYSEWALFILLFSNELLYFVQLLVK